jgi:hypothetical protein
MVAITQTELAKIPYVDPTAATTRPVPLLPSWMGCTGAFGCHSLTGRCES